MSLGMNVALEMGSGGLNEKEMLMCLERKVTQLTADVESVALQMMFLVDILEKEHFDASKLKEELHRLKKRLPVLNENVKELERKL